MSGKVNINLVMDEVLKEADKLAKDAGYAGEYGDRGAAFLREKVRFYKMGMNQEVPKEWLHYMDKMTPEYEEYMRLKKKFER